MYKVQQEMKFEVQHFSPNVDLVDHMWFCLVET